MKVTVHVRSKAIDVSVGDGRQSFKWLAMVISSRLKQFRVLRSTFEDDCRVVLSISDTSGNLINPNDSICDICRNGDAVVAEVGDELPSDNFGNPVMTEWMVAAYVKSESGITWQMEMEAWRDRAHTAANPEKSEETKTTLLYIGEFSDDEVTSAFELDWRQMDWAWFGLADSDIELRDLRELLRVNYALICKVFSHYCGVGKVGEVYGMSMTEFAHLVHSTGWIDYKSNPRRCESIFSSIVTDGTGHSMKQVMSRVDLVYALLTLCHERVTEKGPDVTDAMIETIYTFKTFLEKVLQPLWDSHLSQYTIYCCKEPIFLKTFDDYYDNVKFVFSQLSDKSKIPGSISLQAMKEVVLKSGTIESDKGNIFALAFSETQISSRNDLIPELDELVFAEFVEALCLLANGGVTDSEMTFPQKVRIVFHGVAGYLMSL